MVNQEKGQSISEFLIIMMALTAIGAYLAWKVLPTQGGANAIMNVQNNASNKIAND